MITNLEAINNLIELKERDRAGAFPGKILSYDAATQRARIRPLVQKTIRPTDELEDEEHYEVMSDLDDVPVIHLKAGNVSIHIPVATGDTVLVIPIFACIAEFLETGESGRPQTSLGGITNCVALPGFYASTSHINVSNSAALEIRAGGTTITVTNSNVQIDQNVQIGGNLEVGGNIEALALASRVAQLETNYLAHTHTVSGGATAPPLIVTPVAGGFSSTRVLTDG